MKYKCNDIIKRLHYLKNTDIANQKNILSNLIEGSISDDIMSTYFNDITIIDYYAFYNCSSLTKISIPSTVLTISNMAFVGCTNLTDMYLYSQTPPYVFNPAALNTGGNCTFHVPAGSEDAYKSATSWSNYADRIVGDIIIESEE